ncbi:MAG: O-linked N-acetylglucosamine transferase, SPINDLY family protein [Steroidobacteraceae bacterium]
MSARKSRQPAPGRLHPAPNLAQLYALAVAQQQGGHLQAAIATYKRCLALSSRLPEVHNNLGTALDRAGELAEAVACFKRALALDPAYVRPLVNLGRVLRLQGRAAEALARLERALALSPDNPLALTNLGFALIDLGRSREAADALRCALAVDPLLAEAHHGLGRVLLEQGDALGAQASLRRAIELKPDLVVDAYTLLATSLLVLQRLPEALAVCELLLERRPQDPDALAVRLNCALGTCDWEKIESTLTRIRCLPGGMANARPFLLLGVSDDPAEHLAASRTRAAAAMQGRVKLSPPHAREHDRIRVAYVSGDFFAHATSYLIAELLELHDRSAFEVYGVSFGPDDGSALRQRVLGSFDAWLEGADRSDAEIAAWLREREIDIAVDLKGYTAYCRPGIFACRPAPLQVNYLGYPGTMAAPFIDYLIADRHLIPQSERDFYTEKVVHLPDSYQVNDRRRRIIEQTSTRAEAGLPDEAFVFCCFNNNWKITGSVFDAWMRVLSSVPGSVLWLLEDNSWAAENLRRAAADRGVQSGRLVFAPRTASELHLPRHRLADLFLDTVPYNAHTTASDALWSGLPVLTCTGRTFAARVAASLLSAAGLSELITSSLQEYETLAIELARAPGRLAALRAKLTSDREALPLFDTPRFCRHLEAAYRRMWLRHLQGKAPEAFGVERLGDGER